MLHTCKTEKLYCVILFGHIVRDHTTLCNKSIGSTFNLSPRSSLAQALDLYNGISREEGYFVGDEKHGKTWE